jgi:hypothetical protein
MQNSPILNRKSPFSKCLFVVILLLGDPTSFLYCFREFHATESSETMVNNTELSGSPISLNDLDTKVRNLHIDPNSDSSIATLESSSDPKVKNLQIDPNSDGVVATPEASSSDPDGEHV